MKRKEMYPEDFMKVPEREWKTCCGKDAGMPALYIGQRAVLARPRR